MRGVDKQQSGVLCETDTENRVSEFQYLLLDTKSEHSHIEISSKHLARFFNSKYKNHRRRIDDDNNNVRS